MKLSCCIVSSDLNPLYVDFFPIVHRMWRKLVGVRAVLALIADEVPREIRYLSEDIIIVPPAQGVHPALQAQCVRLLLPQLLGSDDGAVLTSDIDMLPMRRDYFLNALDAVPDDSFVVYRSNVLMNTDRQIAICYNAARPATWRDLFGCVSNVHEINDVLRKWAVLHTYEGKHGGTGWFADQIMLFNSVTKFDAGRVKFFTDDELCFARLDRIYIEDNLSPIQRILAKRHFYADYHMKRPYRDYAALNEKIASMVLSGAFKPSLLNTYLDRLDHKLRRLQNIAAGRLKID